MNSSEQYEAVIGLEVHAQLLTDSKAFCGCTTTFGNEPNSSVCPICLGMPGVLPVVNRRHIESAIRMGLATHSTISPRSVFARKNYFYPDLPKGYQISQYEVPICTDGYVEIDLETGERKRIGLIRIHMEEDAGKSIHDQDVDTLVDINRCGVPLLEIVSRPDIRSAHEAYHYLRKIRQIVTYLGICDGNMEEGSLRCDANVSIRRRGDTAYGTKTEVKNLNSFRHVERALEFEIDRQVRLLENGEAVEQETLLWDADRDIAYPMRSKEEAHDYRYFPEPDLMPILIDRRWIDEIETTLPEHPTTRRDRFLRDFALPLYDADILTWERGYADYFEAVLRALPAPTPDSPKQVSNWIMTEVLRVIGDQKTTIENFRIQPQSLAQLIALINEGTISGKIAKEVWEEMVSTGTDPKSIVEKKGLVQLSDEAAIEKIIMKILESHKPQVEKYLAGNEKVFAFFVGEVMKATKGRANPSIVNSILRKNLKRDKT